MRKTTLELIKKIEKDTEISISATEALTCRIVYARVPRIPGEGTHYLHQGIKYVTGLNEDGNVPVLCDPFASDACSVNPRGPIETIDEFVKKSTHPDSCGEECGGRSTGGKVAEPAAAE